MEGRELQLIGILTLLVFSIFLFWRVLGVVMRSRLQSRAEPDPVLGSVSDVIQKSSEDKHAEPQAQDGDAHK